MGKRKRFATDALASSEPVGSKKIKHEDHLTVQTSHLDPGAQSQYLRSRNAQKVREAVANGDAKAINSGLAPPGLSKKQRIKWKSKQRKLALQSSGPSHDTSGRTDVPEASAEKKERKREKRRRRRRNSVASAAGSGGGRRRTSMAQTEEHGPRPASNTSDTAQARTETITAPIRNIDVKSVAFTRLMVPPTKSWDEPESAFSKRPDLGSNSAQPRSKREAAQHRFVISASSSSAASSISSDSLHSPVASKSKFTSWAPREVTENNDGQQPEVEPSEIQPKSSANKRNAPNLQPLRSRGSQPNAAARRMSMNRNFDIPDYFSGGSLADAERDFEAWARKARGGRSESSDSSDSDSDHGDNDEPSAEGKVIQGSFHESWADAIYGKPKEEPASEPLDACSIKDEAAKLPLVSIKVKKEMDVEPENPAIAHGTSLDSDAMLDLDPESNNDSKIFDLSVAETNDVKAQHSIEQTSFEGSEAEPSSSQDRPSGTANGLPATTRQANVRVKRILSPTDPGGNGSGPGPTESPKRTNSEAIPRVLGHKDEVDKGELSDDVYSAIDEVTQSLLGKENIPSLNECKPPDMPSTLDKDPLITTDASTCHPTSLDVKDDIEQDIAVALENDAATGRDQIHSSPANSRSSSRHSAHPLETQFQTSFNSSVDEPQVQIPLYTTSLTDPVVEGKKARKMTGRSSKHFSLSKKATSKSVAEPTEAPPPQVSNLHPSEQEPSSREPPVSQRTRSALRGDIGLADSEEKDTPTRRAASGLFEQQQSLATYDAEVSECSPLTSLENALGRVSRAAARKASVALHAQVEQDVSSSDKHDKPATNNADDLATPNGTAKQHSTSFKTPQSVTAKPKTPKSKRSTGKISAHFITDRVDLYNTTSSGKRVPAGTSVVPVPSMHAEKFGIVQEKLWHEPFWLLIAVTFLNKTAGRSAMPVFWRLRERYPTPEALADADQAELMTMVHKLGLQNQRSKRLIKIATAWKDDPPVPGRRFKTLHYPSVGDGKGREFAKVIEEDAEDCAGALEIGNMPGCGTYAYDSWRMFCRDVLRGVADDYNGLNAKAKDFEPEWKRVLPEDKELRACMRWMWLREGWIWDPLTGEKRKATEEEMEKAVRGEMEIDDPQERRFAAIAAAENEDAMEDIVDPTPTKSTRKKGKALGPSTIDNDEFEEPHDDSPSTQLKANLAAAAEEEDDHIVVSPVRRRGSIRAAKVVPSVEAHSRAQSEEDDLEIVPKPKAKRESKSKNASGSKRKPRTSQFQADDEADYGTSKPRRRRSARLTTS